MKRTVPIVRRGRRRVEIVRSLETTAGDAINGLDHLEISGLRSHCSRHALRWHESQLVHIFIVPWRNRNALSLWRSHNAFTVAQSQRFHRGAVTVC